MPPSSHSCWGNISRVPRAFKNLRDLPRVMQVASGPNMVLTGPLPWFAQLRSKGSEAIYQGLQKFTFSAIIVLASPEVRTVHTVCLLFVGPCACWIPPPALSWSSGDCPSRERSIFSTADNAPKTSAGPALTLITALALALSYKPHA